MPSNKWINFNNVNKTAYPMTRASLQNVRKHTSTNNINFMTISIRGDDSFGFILFLWRCQQTICRSRCMLTSYHIVLNKMIGDTIQRITLNVLKTLHCTKNISQETDFNDTLYSNIVCIKKYAIRQTSIKFKLSQTQIVNHKAMALALHICIILYIPFHITN